jgi:hypothetical protein
MKTVVAIAAALSLALSSVAQARPHAPAAPSPADPAPRVIYKSCPADQVYMAGCFYAKGLDGQGGPLIYIKPDAYGIRLTRYHELGHAFFSEYANPGERNALARYLRGKYGFTEWIEERAADVYALCRMNIGPSDHDWPLTDYVPTDEHWLRTCALFVRIHDKP